MSLADDTADAIVTALDGLDLTYGGKALTVVRRKSPTLAQQEPMPLLVVTVGEEPDTEYLTAQTNLNRYPVGVAVITGTGTKLADDTGLRTIRQTIRQTIDDRAKTTFADVTGFNRVTTGGKSPYAPGALGKDLNVSTQLFTVELLEPRAT